MIYICPLLFVLSMAIGIAQVRTHSISDIEKFSFGPLQQTLLQCAEKAEAIMPESFGTQFDPSLKPVFEACMEKLRAGGKGPV